MTAKDDEKQQARELAKAQKWLNRNVDDDAITGTWEAAAPAAYGRQSHCEGKREGLKAAYKEATKHPNGDCDCDEGCGSIAQRIHNLLAELDREEKTQCGNVI